MNSRSSAFSLDIKSLREILSELSPSQGERLEKIVAALGSSQSSSDAWQKLTSQKLIKASDSRSLKEGLFELIYKGWDESSQGPRPAWIPLASEIESTNIARALKELKLKSYAEFHQWSCKSRLEFWDFVIRGMKISFQKPYSSIADLSQGPSDPRWLPSAEFNIAESCFQAEANSVALVSQAENGSIKSWTVAQLKEESSKLAGALLAAGFVPGDAIAIDMPMTGLAVLIYLAIVRAGCTVVSIADSFAPDEIKTRLKLSNAKAIFTQDLILRGGKEIPLYEKVVAAQAPKAIVVRAHAGSAQAVKLRSGDIEFTECFANAKPLDRVIARKAHDASNILFSSGTTGEPKVIPWTHTTPIKSAMDAHFHWNVKAADVVAWPTNLGWMMGPFLIYAALLNRATIAVYEGAPAGADFGAFVQDRKVTHLGVVPSIVRGWVNTGCMESLDWSSIKAFASTGECSNRDEMFYLMSLANFRPVIEYCGGTEIGGGYITGTLVQAAAPATFTTPTLGLDFFILDEDGKPTQNGEIFLLPPSIGLSTELLNRNHFEEYFEGTPKGPQGECLRRHGDQVEILAGGFFQAHGRTDDTMNLGGIKVSSVEIERTLNSVHGVRETAAIAVNPKGGGPSLLVVFLVPQGPAKIDTAQLKLTLQQQLKSHLNPLFKIHDLVLVDSLPRTASNKVMRRVLRKNYGV